MRSDVGEADLTDDFAVGERCAPVHMCPGLGAIDAVLRDAPVGLDGPHRRRGLSAVDAVWLQTCVVAEVGVERLLQDPDGIALIANAEDAVDVMRVEPDRRQFLRIAIDGIRIFERREGGARAGCRLRRGRARYHPSGYRQHRQNDGHTDDSPPGSLLVWAAALASGRDAVKSRRREPVQIAMFSAMRPATRPIQNWYKAATKRPPTAATARFGQIERRGVRRRPLSSALCPLMSPV